MPRCEKTVRKSRQKLPTREEIVTFLEAEFPQSPVVVESVDSRSCRIRGVVDESDLRPGGTVSGPSMMALADNALYIATLGAVGIVPLAVTTSLNINFLRKPSAGCDLVAECKLVKVGRVLVVGDVLIYSDGQEEPVAHATGTYSIPPGSE